MILSCNSCGKKFVVPDNAITKAGRLVQCSACGNKWKQFPVKTSEKQVAVSKPVIEKNLTKTISPKKPISPKKHGIKIKDSEPKFARKIVSKDKVSFGFYSSLLVFLVLVVFFSRTLYFAQNFLLMLFPSAEFYLSYFFENIRNIFEIWKSLIANY